MNRTGIATLTTLGLTLLAHAGGAQTLTPIGSAANISSPFNPPLYEASGLGTAKNQSALWAISDGALEVFKLNLNGPDSSFVPTPINVQATITAFDFEGVTYAPPPPGNGDDHFIYVANEASKGILPINYNTEKYYPEAKLPNMIGWSSVPCGSGGSVASHFLGSDPNSGLEGITWDGALNSFFVIKEKNPGLMIRISADLTTIQGCRVLTFSGQDYSDLSYDPARNQFWIVSDEAQGLYLYDWSADHVNKTWHLPYANAEGVAFDPAYSRLYIATDNGDNNTSYMYTYSVQ
jgi:hypothetical protein